MEKGGRKVNVKEEKEGRRGREVGKREMSWKGGVEGKEGSGERGSGGGRKGMERLQTKRGGGRRIKKRG